MKNNKGMTLIEVVIAVLLVGVTATVFFKTAAFGYTSIVESKKYTEDSFEVQENIENEIVKRKDDGSGSEDQKIFGVDIKGHIVKFDIKGDTGSPHGKYTAFIPKIDIEYKVPVLKDDLELTVDGYDENSISMVDDDNKKVKTSLQFKASTEKIIENEDIHLDNIYKWYISPKVNIEDPSKPYYLEDPNDENAAKGFIRSYVNDHMIIKEWNPSRPPKGYALNDLSIVPNIEKDPDFREFSFGELKLKTDDKKYDNETAIETFAGRFIIYSVTPYSDVGRIGKEVFSNPIYIEAIENDDDDDDK